MNWQKMKISQRKFSWNNLPICMGVAVDTTHVALRCRCPGVFSLGLLVSPQLRYSKKEQPLKGDHQAMKVPVLQQGHRVTATPPKNVWRKLSWLCITLRNSQKLSPSKVSHYTIFTCYVFRVL